MEPRKDMAEKDVASIAAASSATAEKIHSLLSASDVGTLKHQQLLMYLGHYFFFFFFSCWVYFFKPYSVLQRFLTNSFSVLQSARADNPVPHHFRSSLLTLIPSFRSKDRIIVNLEWLCFVPIKHGIV
uniref:Uncharacterized protein n=1 Tax=Physcomitrium patens TaxID=3218 RepID=A0A7I3YXY5_PHYPA